jgi:hypothetical protein
MPLTTSPRLATWYFLHTLQQQGIILEKIVFHTETYKQYYRSEYEALLKFASDHPANKFSKSIVRIFKGRGSFLDICNLFGPVHKEASQYIGFIEFLEFSPSEKGIQSLRSYLDGYIQAFISDNLFTTERINFYKFSRQKEIFFEQIEEEIKNFGNRFTFKQGEVVVHKNSMAVNLNEDPSYLFIHILAALEYSHVLEVESIIIHDWEVAPEDQTHDYKVTIKILDESFAKEGGNEDISRKDKFSLLNQCIEFSNESAVIHIGKTEVQLPPYKNEYYLCQVAWEHGIKEPIDWSLIHEKMTGDPESVFQGSSKELWRTVYHAMRAINKRVKEKCGTNDELFHWQDKTVFRDY